MTNQKTEPRASRVVQPVDPARRTEIDKQRVPMSARPYRLLAMVKQDAVVRVQKEPDDTVMTWPHLLSIEFLAAVVMSNRIGEVFDAIVTGVRAYASSNCRRNAEYASLARCS